eukprot:6219243-Prymnesium_polylepis.1
MRSFAEGFGLVPSDTRTGSGGVTINVIEVAVWRMRRSGKFGGNRQHPDVGVVVCARQFLFCIWRITKTPLHIALPRAQEDIPENDVAKDRAFA